MVWHLWYYTTGHSTVDVPLGRGDRGRACVMDHSEYYTYISFRDPPVDNGWGSVAMDTVDNKENMLGDPWMFTPLSELVGEGITLTDTTGRFVIYSPHMNKITGYTVAEAGTLNDYLALLYQHTVEDESAMPGIREMFHRECRDKETVLRAKDGTPRNVSLSTSLLENQGGLFLLHVFRDITSSKRTEKMLLMAEKRYRKLCEQTFEALVVVDTETFLPVDFNDRALELFGYSLDELPEKPIDILETRGIFVQKRFRDLQMVSEEWDDFETEVYTKNAEKKKVIVSVRVVETLERNLFQCIFHELTDGTRAMKTTDKGSGGRHNAKDRTRTLKATIPICYVCKKICDDKGFWRQIETPIGEHSDVLFSHELCPACEQRFYPKPLSRHKQAGE